MWLSLRRIRENEIKHFFEQTDWVAEVRTEETVSTKVREQFVLDQSEPTPAVREVAAKAAGHMVDFLREFLGVVRWRTSVYGHHELIRCAAGAIEWSSDQTAWTPLALGLNAITSSELHAAMCTEPLFRQIADMATKAEVEPIGHELLREAWNLRQSSPRSALMLAVAALEVGVKDFVSRLVPQAEWLCFEVPSPPVVKMLDLYLPTLPVKLRINDKVFIPNEILDTLKVAVLKRNEITHKGRKVRYTESLNEILTCVQMTLYFLDYYSGHQWALDNMRSASVQELLRAELGKGTV